jgi:hypothetical protein
VITLTYPQILDLTNLMRDRSVPSVIIHGDHVEIDGTKVRWDDRLKRWIFESHPAYGKIQGLRV